MHAAHAATAPDGVRAECHASWTRAGRVRASCHLAVSTCAARSCQHAKASSPPSRVGISRQHLISIPQSLALPRPPRWLGVLTRLGGDAALACSPRRPYQCRCLFLRPRAPGQHSGTQPREAVWEQAMEARWLGVPTYSMTRSWGSPTSPAPVAFPFVLERLGNTLARLPEAPPRSHGRLCRSKGWGHADSGCPRGLAKMPHVARTSGAAFPFVLARLSNTLARLPEASLRSFHAAMRGRGRASDGGMLTLGVPTWLGGDAALA